VIDQQPMLDFYTRFYAATKNSPAYDTFCQRVFGMNCPQHGFSDMSQWIVKRETIHECFTNTRSPFQGLALDGTREDGAIMILLRGSLREKPSTNVSRNHEAPFKGLL
jgi:hypothetical protein